ncbi:MAG: hypothetical protein ACE5JS_04510 [Nitrospinota bacterium]
MERIRISMPRCLCPRCCSLAAREGLKTFGFIQAILALAALEWAVGRHGSN